MQKQTPHCGVLLCSAASAIIPGPQEPPIQEKFMDSTSEVQRKDMRAAIRIEMRDKRKAIAESARTRAAEDLAYAAERAGLLAGARKTAIYIENDGELPTGKLIESLRSKGSEIYLPSTHPTEPRTMEFRLWRAGEQLVQGRYGIFEPAEGSEVIDPAELDIIFVPLVAFDAKGNRIGMGGGYYDTLLAKFKELGRGPLPVGIAYEEQMVHELPKETWDMPLPAILTPRRVRAFS